MSKDDSTGKIQWDRLLKKLSPYTVQKGLRYLKHYGLKEFWIRLHERFEPEEVPYGPWYEAYRPTEEKLEKQRKRKFRNGPLISIVVPAYLTPERFLRQMLDSLLAQTYQNWELCLANGSPEDPDMQTVLKSYAEMDKRIRYEDLKENLALPRIPMQLLPWRKGILLHFWIMMICLLQMRCMRLQLHWRNIRRQM